MRIGQKDPCGIASELLQLLCRLTILFEQEIAIDFEVLWLWHLWLLFPEFGFHGIGCLLNFGRRLWQLYGSFLENLLHLAVTLVAGWLLNHGYKTLDPNVFNDLFQIGVDP